MVPTSSTLLIDKDLDPAPDRAPDAAPVLGGGSDEDNSQSVEAYGRWLQLWESLIHSTIDGWGTAYPYSHYLKKLKLNDLSDLLQDPKFTDKVSRSFFQAHMKDFKKTKTFTTAKKKSTTRLDVEPVIEAIGEHLTRRTPVLEELSGPFRSANLQQWITRLPRLRSLAPFHGGSLTSTGAFLAKHCPSFESLSFFHWLDSDADTAFSEFLLDLRSQSLKSLEICSRASINAKTFSALNRHSDSLTELKLGALEPEAIPSLSLLHECTNLTTLSFSEAIRGTVDLEGDHPDICSELTSWLMACKSLRSLTITQFKSTASLLAPVLQNTDLRLTHMELSGYSLERAVELHIALGSQTALKNLTLRGEAQDSRYNGDVSQSLARAVMQLNELEYLDLKTSSDAFRDDDIISIAKTHPNLETWWTGGMYITDKVLKAIGSMKRLKRLECWAMTRFSRNGLQGFFNSLRSPGNEGFNFAINAPDDSEEYDLSPDDEDYIRSLASSSVNGNIEFPAREDGMIPGYEMSDSE